MIAVVDSSSGKTRTPWGFWIGCALAVAGGITPLLLAGPSGRVTGVIYPFWFGALAMAACALLQHRGRFIATVLYMVAALAIVYGILAMFAVMIQMTVLTPCPAAPEPCQLGFASPLTSGESTGLNLALALGMLAVGFGFAGIVANYRLHRSQTVQSTPPPVRRLAPQPAHQPEPPPAEEDTPVTTEGAPE